MRRLGVLVLAFVAVSLAGVWRLWAGLGTGVILAAWLWSWESSGMGALRRFLSQMEAGDFGAGLPEGHGGALARLKPGCEAMAMALRERFSAAEELRRRLMAALNGMNEGVALCDSEGVILLINPAFRRLAGFEEPILRRCFLWEAVRDPQLNAAADAALHRFQSTSVDLPLDRGRIEGRALVTPVEGLRGGSGAGVVVFLFDRTEERKVERLRSEFVANVSHELRTPLAAIKAALETLRDGALADPQVNQAFLGKALRHSDRLEELLADLLTLSRIEEQRRRGLASPQASCSVSEAWAEVDGLLEPTKGEAPGRVRVELADGLPAVRIEKGALRQILVNYVANALKHAGPEPVVRVGARRDLDMVEVWVEDEGPGIPEGDLPRVFERFFRVEKARTRGAGGSGLGLSIVKHLAENAGGQVGAENLAPGCRFWVRLKAV